MTQDLFEDRFQPPGNPIILNYLNKKNADKHFFRQLRAQNYLEWICINIPNSFRYICFYFTLRWKSDGSSLAVKIVSNKKMSNFD